MSRQANFTNELSLDGAIRLLRNEMGLRLLQETLRSWGRIGLTVELPELLGRAAREPALRSVVDVDDPVFAAPGDMPARIAAVCRATGQPAPTGQPQVVRCILRASRLGTAAPSLMYSGSPGFMPTSCTSSAEAPATSCSASSRPMHAGRP